MNWISLDLPEKISEIKVISGNQRVLIFMFSPKDTVNYVVRFLLDREWNEDEMKMKTYVLDLAGTPELSNDIEKEFGVTTMAPQVLIIENGKAVFNASFGKILFSEIRKFSN
jgi:bacillithiol system protein YtxJ